MSVLRSKLDNMRTLLTEVNYDKILKVLNILDEKRIPPGDDLYIIDDHICIEYVPEHILILINDNEFIVTEHFYDLEDKHMLIKTITTSCKNEIILVDTIHKIFNY